MTLAELRLRRRVSLEQCATELGLKPNSKGYLSRLERGQVPFPIRIALQVETWSDGILRAVDLLPPEDARLLAASIARASTSPLSVEAAA